MESSELYLAADSGGTKTDWAAFDRTGKVILNGRTEGLAGLNHAPVSFTQFELQTVKFAALKPKAVYLSLGGPNTGEVEGFLRKRFPESRVRVEREADGNMILFAASFRGCRAAVMAGTGSTAMGEIGGRRVYAGGWGPAYGDDGAGGGIGFRALRSYLRSLDSLESCGRIADLFRHLALGLDPRTFAGRMELKSRANAMTRRELAALAPALAELAEQGDASAKALLEHAALENARLAAAVTPPSGSGKILGCGGIFRLGASFLHRCEAHLRELRPEQEWVWLPDFSPVKAAMLFLLHGEGFEITADLRERILRETL